MNFDTAVVLAIGFAFGCYFLGSGFHEGIGELRGALNDWIEHKRFDGFPEEE